MATGFKSATVNAGSVPSTQTNFPSYVDLSRLGITTLAEANSVRVYADSAKTTEWAREIVSLSEMHVKVPSLTNSVVMYVDWDGSRADYAVTDTYGRNAVWTGYASVYHMEHASGDATDSTGNGLTLTNNGTTPYATNKIGQGADYGTSNSTKSHSRTSAGFAGGNFTFTTWVKIRTEPTSGQAHQILVPRKVAPPALDCIMGYRNDAGTLKVVFDRGKSGIGSFEVTENVTLGTANWHHLHMTFDGSTLRGYRNGASVGTPLSTSGNGNTGGDALVVAGYSGSRVSAYLDEIRISNTQYSADWILTEYNNQNAESTFWGTWTTVGGGGGGSRQQTLTTLGVGV